MLENLCEVQVLSSRSIPIVFDKQISFAHDRTQHTQMVTNRRLVANYNSCSSHVSSRTAPHVMGEGYPTCRSRMDAVQTARLSHDATAA